MRPGSLIAAACLALLSYLRFAEQAYVLAGVFAILSLGALALGLSYQGGRATAPVEPPPERDVRAAQEAHERYRRGWRRIAVVGFAVSGVGVFLFPPMSLVVAGLSLYAVHRLRQSSRSAHILAESVRGH